MRSQGGDGGGVSEQCESGGAAAGEETEVIALQRALRHAQPQAQLECERHRMLEASSAAATRTGARHVRHVTHLMTRYRSCTA